MKKIELMVSDALADALNEGEEKDIIEVALVIQNFALVFNPDTEEVFYQGDAVAQRWPNIHKNHLVNICEAITVSDNVYRR